MPDIGLLQGPPRAKAAVLPFPPQDAAPPPVAEPLSLADAAEDIRVAAHAAVVSEHRPIARISAAPEPEPEPEPEQQLEPEPEPASETLQSPASRTVNQSLAAAEGSLVTAASVPAPVSEPRAELPAAASLASPPSTPQSAATGRPTPPAALSSFTPPPLRWSDLAWLLVALLVIIGTGLGIREPWPADEPRFASLARDMVASGEWLFPRVGGDLYQDKPPVFFWLLALCFTLFGSWKGWFLIPAFLAAAGVLFLIYDFGRRTVSREAGLAAALLVCCSLQFVLAMRGAQIDPVLCLLTTFALYALLRHLLLGHGWHWYVLGALAAGVGVITKGVGFLPLLLLIPFFALRAFGWQGLAQVDAGRAGWRWWLGPLAMLAAISLWFVPMLIAASDGSPDHAAYRDEILFKQTVGRYAAAWHHVKGWYYFLAEVIPPLWLPWSLLLFWLVPRFKSAFQARDARVWLPLFWVLIVLLFFSASPGKRGIYILPALPALALASLPVLTEVLARRGVRIAGFVLASLFLTAALVLSLGYATGQDFAVRAVREANLGSGLAVYVYVALCTLGMLWAWRRAPLLAWPAALASLTLVFSYFIAPAMNGERSGRDFMATVLSRVQPGEQLGLVAYKEQFLLYLDRPTTNFGHRRWQEGPQEYFDAAAWLNAAPGRVLLVPEEALVPKNRFDLTQPAIPCFTVNTEAVGVRSDDHWFLVRAPAESACAALGQSSRAIAYPLPPAS